MTIHQRSVQRQTVWEQMLRLEQDGLGVREFVSEHRDRFMLNVDHGAASKLSTRIHARGFIRADATSLLFRDASDKLRHTLDALKPGAAMASDKGFEIRWSAIDAADIVRMFDAVRLVSG